MGSYNEHLVGRGKSKSDALDNAWTDYVYENGHRCSLRKVEKAKKLRDVPPVKMMTREESGYGLGRYAQRQKVTVHYSAEDPTAPKSEWLEEWEFEVWVHA